MFVAQQAGAVGGLKSGDPLSRGGEEDAVPGLGGFDAEPDREVGLAGFGSDSDRLQHLRAALPCEVRVVTAAHPLFGSLLAAEGFRRVDGTVFLVVRLPDGSPGTTRADATDVLGASGEDAAGTVLDGEGLWALHALVARLRPARGSGRASARDDK